jgi:hypothetical protein
LYCKEPARDSRTNGSGKILRLTSKLIVAGIADPGYTPECVDPRCKPCAAIPVIKPDATIPAVHPNV